jgi:hypothetical protein
VLSLDQSPESHNKKGDPRSGWMDRAVPEVVRPDATTPEKGAWDAPVPASDPVVRAAYSRTGALPSLDARPATPGTDALVIHRNHRQARAINFEVEGIHWRAGFAPDTAQSPLNPHYLAATPPENNVSTSTGVLLQPVEAALESVLRDLVPPALLSLADNIFGPKRMLGRCVLYYIPTGPGAQVGMIAWYIETPIAKGHLLFLQTNIKKANPAIMAQMHQTFQASLKARGAAPTTPGSFDFWRELSDASRQIEFSLRHAGWDQNEFKQAIQSSRSAAEARLYDSLLQVGRLLYDLLETLLIKWPQRLIVWLVITTSRALLFLIKQLPQRK